MSLHLFIVRILELLFDLCVHRLLMNIESRVQRVVRVQIIVAEVYLFLKLMENVDAPHHTVGDANRLNMCAKVDKGRRDYIHGLHHLSLHVSYILVYRDFHGESQLVCAFNNLERGGAS